MAQTLALGLRVIEQLSGTLGAGDGLQSHGM